jgi:DNA-binding GntR family transcriptional regulator
LRNTESSEIKKWAAALRDAHGSGLEQPEPGFYTAEELGSKLNLGTVTVREYLRCLIKLGGVEIRKYRRLTGTRRMRINHYRLPPSPPKDNP